MNEVLLKKKEALIKNIKERDMEEFFTVRDSTDGKMVFFDASESTQHGAKLSFRIYLDESVFNVVQIAFYLLTDNNKRTLLLEKINEKNVKTGFSKYILGDDNVLTVEFTYSVLNEDFNPAFLIDLLMLQMETLDNEVYPDFMESLA